MGGIYGPVENCTNDGNIVFQDCEWSYAGGIVGFGAGFEGTNGIFKNCINNGNITISRTENPK